MFFLCVISILTYSNTSLASCSYGSCGCTSSSQCLNSGTCYINSPDDKCTGHDFSGGWTDYASVSGKTGTKEKHATCTICKATFYQFKFTINYYASSSATTASKTETVTCMAYTTSSSSSYTTISSGSYTLLSASSANVSVATGYHFNNWVNKSTGSGYSASQVLTFTASSEGINFYAATSANKYTITFNSNGGSGSMSDMTCYYGSTYTLTSNSFTRTGYKFLGWSTSSSAKTATYVNKDSVSNLTSTNNGTVTLYAVWGKYTLTLNANGGVIKGTTDTTKTYTMTYSTTNNNTVKIATKTGYTFDGWYTSKSGGTQVYDSSGNWCSSATGYWNSSGKWIYTGKITLYAHWTPKEYTITYKYTDGTEIATKKADYGSTITLRSLPTDAGYTVTGWNDKKDFSGSSYTAKTSYTVTGNKTLYCKKTAKKYTITFVANYPDGSTATEAMEVTYGKTYTLPKVSEYFSCSGFSSTGYWHTKKEDVDEDCSSSCTSYKGGKSIAYTYTKNITLYADWNRNSNTYAINYYYINATTEKAVYIGTDYVIGGSTFVVRDSQSSDNVPGVSGYGRASTWHTSIEKTSAGCFCYSNRQDTIVNDAYASGETYTYNYTEDINLYTKYFKTNSSYEVVFKYCLYDETYGAYKTDYAESAGWYNAGDTVSAYLLTVDEILEKVDENPLYEINRFIHTSCCGKQYTGIWSNSVDSNTYNGSANFTYELSTDSMTTVIHFYAKLSKITTTTTTLPTYTVNYYYNDSGTNCVYTYTAYEGEKITVYADLEADEDDEEDGVKFCYWLCDVDNECYSKTNSYYESTYIVTCNTNFYGQWDANPPSSGEGGGDLEEDDVPDPTDESPPALSLSAKPNSWSTGTGKVTISVTDNPSTDDDGNSIAASGIYSIYLYRYNCLTDTSEIVWGVIFESTAEESSDEEDEDDYADEDDDEDVEDEEYDDEDNEDTDDDTVDEVIEAEDKNADTFKNVTTVYNSSTITSYSYTYTEETEGIYYYRLVTYDNCFNRSATTSDTIYLDNSAPTLYTSLSSSTWTNEAITITASATDYLTDTSYSGSGIAKLTITDDSGNVVKTATNSTASTLAVSKAGGNTASA